ncbi:MAG: DMT family transporter [Rhodobacteraceae bacterium]|nr:DMT family transporter [Paracoccaceae bacterium]
MFFAALFSFPLLALLAHRDQADGSLWPRRPGWVFLRAATSVISTVAAFYAFGSLPLAQTYAILFAIPLIITLLSILVLGEQVTPLRWLALLTGFAGVLVMVRPGSDLFTWATFLPLVSGLCYGGAMVLARRMGNSFTAAAMAFHSNLIFLVNAALLSLIFGTGQFTNESQASLGFLTRGWTMPALPDLLGMMACGGIAAIGLTLLTQAYRIAQASIVAPFEYTGLIWSVLYGWIFWRDWPDATGWTGIAIIVGAGLLVLYGDKTRPPAKATP